MTDPKLTGWIKGQPLKSRPGPYEVAIEVTRPQGKSFLYAQTRWRWLGDKWESGALLHWSHFRGLAEKP